MNPDKLPSLLSMSSTESPGRGAACPDEHVIAAYVDGTLQAEQRSPLETHLADCDHCLVLVGLLSRELTVTAADRSRVARAPAQPLEQTPPSRRRPGRLMPHIATAAVVVIAVSALVRLTLVSEPTSLTTATSDWRTTRSAPARGPNLQLLSPRPGETIKSGQLTIRWTPVAGSHYYDVRVVTGSGDVVAAEQVGGTELRLPSPGSLHPGAEYFVHVDAFISEDKAVSSEHVAFRVSE